MSSTPVASTSTTDVAARPFNLRRRLILVMLLVGLIPLLLATGLAHHFARKGLEEAAISKLVAVREARARHIQDTYALIGAQVRSLAADCSTVAGLPALSAGLRALPEEMGEGDDPAVLDAARAEVRAYYEGPYAEFYVQGTGDRVDTAPLLPREAYAIVAQALYIAENPFPLGQKDGLDRPAGDTTAYGAVHAEHHPIFRGFHHNFGFYDIFLVDLEGVVVYSVTKEIDFATNLFEGPYADSGFAETVRRALQGGEGEVFLSDYGPYTPSALAPAAFIAAPVFARGQRLGALVFQMPIGRINDVMTDATGLGETGETYLVGRDFLMRSDSRFAEKGAILVQRVDTAATRSAFDGAKGAGIVTDYRGVEVLSAWTPLRLLGLDYALVAEVDAMEALAPARRLFYVLMGLTALLGLLAIVSALLVGAALARPVGRITERLEGLAQHLLSESQEEQAGAAEQSAAVEETRQTFQGLLEAGSRMNRIGGEVLGHAEVSQQSAQTIRTRIAELSTSATTITDVLNLVKEIANKSEILALNAALEGTKAGEAGRGFSLVAQQMQRLAEQVMESVKTIESLTGDISNASSGAVLAAEEAAKVSRMTTEAARDISGAVGTQQTSAEQISVAMNEIAQVAGRNVEAARHVVTSSNDLLALAAELRRTVGVGD